jgi:ribonuclease HI
MNPELKLHRAILNALKEFPGIDRVVIQSDLEGIEVIFNHGGRWASRRLSFREYGATHEDLLEDHLVRLFDKMAKAVRPNHPGRGAAWGWSKFP